MVDEENNIAVTGSRFFVSSGIPFFLTLFRFVSFSFVCFVIRRSDGDRTEPRPLRGEGGRRSLDCF